MQLSQPQSSAAASQQSGPLQTDHVTTAQPPPMTTFQDAIQSVPYLLHSCVASLCSNTKHSGVARMRLVCKASSKAALQMLHSYHLTLSHKKSRVEPLLAVAKLLQHTQLQVLLVDIIVPSRECRPSFAISGSLTGGQCFSDLEQINMFASNVWCL